MQYANKVTVLLTLAGLCAGLVSCESANVVADNRPLQVGPPLAIQKPRAYDVSANPIAKPLAITDDMYASASPGPRLVERITMTGGSRTITGGVPEFEMNTPGSRVVRVKYKTESASLDEVLAVLITDFLDRDFVMDAGITGLVNLSIDEELDTQELERFIGGLCSLHGLRMSEQDGRYIIRKGAANTAKGGSVPPNAPIYTAEPLLGNEMPAIRLRKLRYASPENVKTLLTELMSEGSLVSASGQMLMLVDTTSQIKRMSQIIETLDVPAFENTELLLYELGSVNAVDAQALLGSLASASGLAGTSPLVSFIAMPNHHDLLVIARDPSVARQAENLITLIDRPADAPVRGRFMYTAQNTSASSLVSAFSEFFPDRIEGDDNPTGVRFVQYSHSAPSFGISSELSGGGSGGASSARTILMYASPKDYRDILTLFAELDKPPQQVNMRVVVAEVGLNDDLSFGVEYFLNAADTNNSGNGFGNLDLLGTPGGIASPTASIFFTATDGFAVIEALDRVTTTKLLSSPTLSAVSGGIASINVGGEEPIPAGEVVSSGGNVTNTIDRRETGITVRAQPFVNESGMIRINMQIDIAGVNPNPDPVLGPSFTTRILETDVLTKHGQTFLLGGIIIDNSGKSQDKIPGLGDIPILGAAFGTQSDTYSRTELIIAVTCTIANTPDDADAFMTDFLRSTHAVREALTERVDDLAQGFLFDRIGADEQAAMFESPAAPEPVVEQAPAAQEPEVVPSNELKIPPMIRRLLESGGSAPPKNPESDG